MGTMQFTTIIAQIFSMMLSGYLVDRWNWHTPFLLGVIISIFGFILTFFVKEPKEDSFRVPIRMKDLISVMHEQPRLLKISFLSVLAHSILFITMFGFTPNQAINLGASKYDLGLLTLSFMVPHAAASLIIGRIFVSQRFFLIFGFIGSAIFTFSIPYATTFSWLCLTQACNGLAQGFIFPLLLAKAVEGVASEKRGTAMGLYQAIYAIGMFMGPFLAGWLSSMSGLAGGFKLAASVGLLAGLLSFFWGKEKKINKSMEI